MNYCIQGIKMLCRSDFSFDQLWMENLHKKCAVKFYKNVLQKWKIMHINDTVTPQCQHTLSHTHTRTAHTLVNGTQTFHCQSAHTWKNGSSGGFNGIIVIVVALVGVVVGLSCYFGNIVVYVDKIVWLSVPSFSDLPTKTTC